MRVATMVLDCPRCGANNMTFDIRGDVFISQEHNWVSKHEIFSVCRRCDRPSLAKVSLTNYGMREKFLGKDSVFEAIKADVSQIFRFDRFVSLPDIKSVCAPIEVPADVASAFNEGATCLAIGCHNAAAAMFRLALDLATKSLLDVDVNLPPSAHERRNLAPRLRWLFDNGVLPTALKSLAIAVKEDGDSGAHDGSLVSNDAEDLLDFATVLLDRLYVEPNRLAEAEKRRIQRRAPSA